MAAEALTCWNCGYHNPAGAKFCVNCGKPQGAACPECGSPITDDARFCPNCGTSLIRQRGEPGAPILTTEARKVITVLFCDLVGSTGLTERLDPEEAREVVGRFYEFVRRSVERYEGMVANLLGDAVLVVFGLPAAHEDDPERAVRASLDIVDSVPKLNEQLRPHGLELAVRIGINTGEVVAASGSTFDRDFLVSDAVTTAARLQQASEPGSVVVGERTYRLTQSAIEYRSMPPLDAKGKTRPLAAWRVIRVLLDRSEGGEPTAPLVGRSSDLSLVQALYARARDHHVANLVTILGQPGVGKTRLLREFLAGVRGVDPPPTVLRGRGVAFAGQIGYFALLAILRTQAGVLVTDTPDVVRGKVAAWLRASVPDDGSLLDGIMLTFGSGNGATADPEQVRRRLFEAWTALVRALAERSPVVLAIEDLHWADDAVLDLLEHLHQTLVDLPLFVVCAARFELLERRPGWSGGGRNTLTVGLEPLPPAQTREVVEALAGHRLSPETVDMISQRAEGNPLFAEELVRMALEGGTTTIPDTVQAVLVARIDRLPPAERQALQAAAVIGRTFWPSGVAALAGLGPADAQQAIQALVAKALVARRSQSSIPEEPEFFFRQSLARDAAYGLLPKSQRQRAHAEAARWLEEHATRTEEVVEILAEHFRLSGDHVRAAAYLHRAANKARRQYANTEALRLFGQALEAAQQAGAPPRQIAELLCDRAHVHELVRDYAASLRDFQAALETAREAADVRMEAVAENRIGRIHHREYRLDQAERHFERAAQLARAVGDHATVGLSLVDLANVRWDRGRVAPDDPALTEGLRLLREHGDGSSLARALNLLGMCHFSAGNGSEAIESIEEALAVARQAADRSKEATSLSYLCVVHGYLARFTQAEEYGRQALEVAREIGDIRRVLHTQTFIANNYILEGRLGDGLRELRGVLADRQPPAGTAEWFAWQFLAQVYHEIGYTEGLRAIAGAVGDSPAFQNPGFRRAELVPKAQVALARPDTDTLGRILDELMSLPTGTFIPDEDLLALPVGMLLLQAGRLADVRTLVDRHRPGTQRFGSPLFLTALEVLEGLLAAAEGRLEDADTHLRAAVQLAESNGAGLGLWHALEARVSLLDRQEDRAALRALVSRIAASLPDDLRQVLLESPRAAILRD
jgi:predicted ATPase/class 3 adenylate cyclase